MSAIVDAIKPQWYTIAGATAALGIGLGAGVGLTLRLFSRKKAIRVPAAVNMNIPEHAAQAIVEMAHQTSDAVAPITSPDAAEPKLPSNFIHVPLLSQPMEHTSGITCLQALFTYWGDQYRYDKLAERICGNEKYELGFTALANTARAHQYQVTERHGMQLGDLLVAINKHQPVLVYLQAWPDLSDPMMKNYEWRTMWNSGRYAIVVGYDTHHLYFMDPATIGHYTCILIEDFLLRWHGMDPQDPTERLEHAGMIIEKDHAPMYHPNLIISMQ